MNEKCETEREKGEGERCAAVYLLERLLRGLVRVKRESTPSLSAAQTGAASVQSQLEWLIQRKC